MSRHGAEILSGGGASWAVCCCGWRSQLYPTNTAASIVFAAHVAVASQPTTREADMTDDEGAR